MHVIKFKKGDIVWTSINTFGFRKLCFAMWASVDFVDIDLEDYNLCIENLKLNLKKPKKIRNTELSLIHFAGRPCKMKKFIVYQKNITLK